MNYVLHLLFCMVFLFTIHCEKITDTFFSDQDDVNMGLNFDKEIRGSNTNKILAGHQIESYVQNITNSILKSNFVKRKKIYPYKVTVIHDDEVINAYCTPGGFIYVYTGLIKFLENEASLAAILAHEIAHAEKRHSRQRLISAVLLQIIISLFLGKDSSWLVEMALSFVGEMTLLSNSRSDELEADQLAFIYLKSTPYFQGSMSYFFDKIEKLEKKSNQSKVLEKILSTHPIAEDRLKANENRVKKAKLKKPNESSLFSKRYRDYVQTISSLSEPNLESQDEQ